MDTLDPNAWLMGAGGPPAISWRNKPIGHTVTGTVYRESLMQQQRDPEDNELLWWDAAKTQPKMQLVVFIQTNERDPSIEDDDGTRRLFVKGKSMTDGMREAVKRSGRKGIEIGAQVTVTFIGEGEQKNKVYNPPKLYRVDYRPPADAASAAFFDQGGTTSTGTTTMTYSDSSGGGTATMTRPAPLQQTIPAGFDPAAWAGLAPAQRDQILKAMAGSGGFTTDEPPF